MRVGLLECHNAKAAVVEYVPGPAVQSLSNVATKKPPTGCSSTRWGSLKEASLRCAADPTCGWIHHQCSGDTQNEPFRYRTCGGLATISPGDRRGCSLVPAKTTFTESIQLQHNGTKICDLKEFFGGPCKRASQRAGPIPLPPTPRLPQDSLLPRTCQD